ncbi:MAG TPA: chorismate synthase [Bacteroidales bacterium]|nr:chorismate synthase [Bacteroidales bacterium]HPJ58841.1 chorismate synthase [Bacteroidales bacterium]HPR10997.1 chorismate synthase [Bacteroidales bacterium]HRW84477.1 chorismate synthase [Bacteroidales bacterium]
MNTFGQIFRVSVFGESHGPAIGVVIDGCPAGIPLRPEDFSADLSRRQSGSRGTTKRKEADLPEFLSGIYREHTTGAPLTIITRNSDRISSDYNDFIKIPRPGHADMTAAKKYSGFADMRGSGHFSGRITWGLVAAGVIARKIAGETVISARIVSVAGSEDIEGAVEKAVASGDSVGGIIECRVKKLPAGLGEPFFNSFESVVSHLVFAIPAIKGIEFGAGFSAASMRGSEHNDPIINEQGVTLTNNAGGINGGITNGNDVVFRVAVKPTSSTGVEQKSYNLETGKIEPFTIAGRHDTCIALRMPVIIEAVTAIGIADLLLIDRGMNPSRYTPVNG